MSNTMRGQTDSLRERPFVYCCLVYSDSASPPCQHKSEQPKCARQPKSLRFHCHRIRCQYHFLPRLRLVVVQSTPDVRGREGVVAFFSTGLGDATAMRERWKELHRPSTKKIASFVLLESARRNVQAANTSVLFHHKVLSANSSYPGDMSLRLPLFARKTMKRCLDTCTAAMAKRDAAKVHHSGEQLYLHEPITSTTLL